MRGNFEALLLVRPIASDCRRKRIVLVNAGINDSLTAVIISFCEYVRVSLRIYSDMHLCMLPVFTVCCNYAVALCCEQECTISGESEPKCNVEHCTYPVVCYV